MDQSTCDFETDMPELSAISDTDEEMTHDAFAELVLSHQSALWRAARRFTHDRVAAEDLVQETFLRALRARGAFRLRDFGMRPWLLRIMRNLYLSQLASTARRPAVLPAELLDCLPATNQYSSPASRDGGYSLHALDEMDQELAGAIRELPRAHQAVLMLWAVEGLTYHEVAAAVQAPAGTVMSRLHRARGRLCRRLGGFAAGQGLAGHRVTAGFRQPGRIVEN